MSENHEYMNVTGRIIVLTGPPPQLAKIQFMKSQRRILSSYFDRYVPRYIRHIRKNVNNVNITSIVQDKTPTNLKVLEHIKRTREVAKDRAKLNMAKYRAAERKTQQVTKTLQNKPNCRLGHTTMRSTEATAYLSNLLQKVDIPISNDIGIGILSYNRKDSIARLIGSIRKFTDLKRTTVIISDESSDEQTRQYLSSLKDVAVLLNNKRLGVAGNSNRLIRCLSRFKYKIILNDDVEIMRSGWENLYVKAMRDIGYHHLCMRQPGVYGASSNDGNITTVNGFKIRTIQEKPHGAVFAFDDVAFNKVGYFDENFGLYGMEHVDWSNRVSLSGIQPCGYHDIVGSEAYFKIHHDKSAVDSRSALLSEARKKFETVHNDKSRLYVNASNDTKVEGITYIVPFQIRDQNRHYSIRTVLLNIKAQRYPYIEIIMVEQDNSQRLRFSELSGTVYVLAKGMHHDQPFTKSIAFNSGVAKATQNKLILHDADMLVYDGYTAYISNLLNNYDAIHVGKSVSYLTKESTDATNKDGVIAVKSYAERNVEYFEGGSLACTYNTYASIGGHNDDFVGFGCEDTEFFSRLKTIKFHNNRNIDFIHLNHGRSHGWKQYHDRNKHLERILNSQPMNERIQKLCSHLNSKYGIKPR